MSAPLADAAARDRIRGDLATTFVVEAAAGTGKTTALVERVVASVAAGRSTLDRTVVVTFTDSVSNHCGGAKVIARQWTATMSAAIAPAPFKRLPFRTRPGPVLSC